VFCLFGQNSWGSPKNNQDNGGNVIINQEEEEEDFYISQNESGEGFVGLSFTNHVHGMKDNSIDEFN
jgi:hypothetical protein